MHTRNVLYLLEQVGLGGGETSFLTFLDALDRGRFHPVVVLPTDGALRQLIQQRGITTELLEFPPVTHARLPWRAPVVARAVNALCQQHRISLIHSHSFHALWYAAVAGWRRQVPIIWTCHGWWPASRLTGLWISHTVARVIAVSRYVVEKLLTRGHVDAGKVRLIHLGVDVGRFRPDASRTVREDLGVPEGALVVGMVARFQPIKGQLEFVQAADVVRRRLTQCKFVIVGSNVFQNPEDERYLHAVQHLITTLGLEETVILAGFRSDIPHVLNALDLLVVPSRMETFSLVVVEAMAVGTPVIASKVGGILDLVEDGREGLLVAASDPAGMAEAILQLAQDPERRRAMSRAARAKAAEQFNIQRLVKDVEALYDELLSKRVCDAASRD